jgi:hypothetical protein
MNQRHDVWAVLGLLIKLLRQPASHIEVPRPTNDIDIPE